MFHKVDDVPEGNNVYFKKPSGFIDLSFKVQDGDVIKHHYKELNNVFPNSPEYNKNIVDYTSVVTKGEGY